MNEGPFSIHQVEFVVYSREYFRDGSSIGYEGNGSGYFGYLAAGKYGWRLVIDAAFESSWRPIDKLNGFPRGIRGRKGNYPLVLVQMYEINR